MGKFGKKRKISTILLLTMLFMTAPSYADVASRLNVYYNNGITYMKEKKYTSAIIEFRKVIRLRPYDSVVRDSIIKAYLARAQYYQDVEKAYKKAINDYRSALTYLKYWDGEPDGSQKILADKAEGTLSYLKRMYAPIKTGEQINNEAVFLRAQGEFAASIYEFAELYKTNTYGKFAYSINSDIYKSLNNEKMAIECIRTAISKDNTDGELHLKYALILEEIQNQDAAADEYSLALKYSSNDKKLLDSLQKVWLDKSIKNPKDSQALINLGAILQKKGETELAKAQYIKARQINPNDPVALINLASAYTQLEDYDSAIRTYDEILLKNPKDLSARFYKGKLYEQKGDISSAIKQYKEILALKPEDENANGALNALLSSLTGEKLSGYLLNEATAHPMNYDAQFKYAFEMHKNKKYLPAIEYYKKCVALNQSKPEPYINMAQIFIEQNELEKANNVVNHGLLNNADNQELLKLKDAMDKTRANNLYAKGSELFNQKNYREALEYYTKINYQTPEILTMIANCYYEMNDGENAIKYYNKVLEKDPKNTNALMMIANQLVTFKKEEQAKTYLNHILSINPNNTDAKNMLIAIKEGQEGKLLETAVELYENKKFDTAFDILDQLSNLNPKNAYAYYYKGAILDEKGKTEEAIAEYKNAIANDPNFSLAYYMAAVAYDTKENYKEAANFYDKFIQLKAKEGVTDEFSTYAQTRSKELKDFLKASKE